MKDGIFSRTRKEKIPEVIGYFPKPDVEVSLRGQETRCLGILDEFRDGKEACKLPCCAVRPAIAKAIIKFLLCDVA